MALQSAMRPSVCVLAVFAAYLKLALCVRSSHNDGVQQLVEDNKTENAIASSSGAVIHALKSAAASLTTDPIDEMSRSFSNLQDDYKDGKCPLTGDRANYGCGFKLASCSCSLGPAQYCWQPSAGDIASKIFSGGASKQEITAATVGICTVQVWAWVALAFLIVTLLGVCIFCVSGMGKSSEEPQQS
eukprot:TRINITY_DN33903_c0_g1_i1.p1 TRINITY_DN33903_c0_g1~~TRINITY_DN33903_c0_g1_i1.p1  ORF type:complete len:187 (+),score=48.05 TRINITY_DN33903_c0_g1_i1:79-639(+)